MSAKKKHVPKLWQWRLESLGHSVLESLVCRLPSAWAFRLGEMLCGLIWYLVPMRRKIVLRNLRIAFAGEKDLPELRRMAKETFRRSSANLISAAHTARLSPEKLRRLLEVENLHLLEQAQAEGKGVVILLAHMGNWELLTKLVHIFPQGSKCGAFYRPLNNPLIDDRIRRRRQIDGMRMFSKRDPFHQVSGFLREGGIVGILADQRVGRRGELVPFFGRLTHCSPLPGLLARRAKSEVLALSLVTVSPGKWKAVLRPVCATPTTEQCMMALEQAMIVAPIDVFWLQDRWKIKLRRSQTISDWLGADLGFQAKPYRAILWLVGSSQERIIPDAWFHPYVDYEVVLGEGENPPAWLPKESKIHIRLSRHSAEKTIGLIDGQAALPIDFIVTRSADPSLAAAASHAVIPLFCLP